MQITLLMHAATAQVAQCTQLGGGSCDTGLPQVQANTTTLQSVFQIIFGIAGAVALLIIVIAALQLITSGGDPQGVARARNTIIYAAVGLAVCIFAEILVTFVITNV